MTAVFKGLIFCIAVGITVGLCHVYPNASRLSDPGIKMALPSYYGSLEGREEEVSHIVKETLPPDTKYLKMSYTKFGEEVTFKNLHHAIWVTLVLSGQDRRSLHEPEICLRAQGWELERSDVVPIQTEGGLLKVRDLKLGRWLVVDGQYVLDDRGERVRQNAHYVYWWVGERYSTPNTDERVYRTLLGNLFRNQNERWAYPSVMSFVEIGNRSDEADKRCRERIYKFIGSVAPTFQYSLGATRLDG